MTMTYCGPVLNTINSHFKNNNIYTYILKNSEYFTCCLPQLIWTPTPVLPY